MSTELVCDSGCLLCIRINSFISGGPNNLLRKKHVSVMPRKICNNYYLNFGIRLPKLQTVEDWRCDGERIPSSANIAGVVQVNGFHHQPTKIFVHGKINLHFNMKIRLRAILLPESGRICFYQSLLVLSHRKNISGQTLIIATCQRLLISSKFL